MSHGITDKDSMFSVRQMPWHGLGVVLDDYPTGIDDALEKSGLTWAVKQGDVFVARPLTGDDLVPSDPLGHAPGFHYEHDGVYVPSLESVLMAAPAYRANVREDTGDVLGIVSEDYKIVPNRDAFAWLDELLGTEVEFETAGSLNSGRRVWVLAKIPELVEVGGDPTATYIYAANSHDGSMAVTAAATKIRIVCANTLGAALRQGERAPERVYKFRHTGDMQEKMHEARKVMGIVLNWDAAFKEMGDELAREPITVDALEKRVLNPLVGLPNDDLGKIAKRNREETKESIIDIFRGDGPKGDTTGNSPGTKWTAFNAIAEHADWGRRYTKRTDQMHRSFEDQALKEKALKLVTAA